MFRSPAGNEGDGPGGDPGRAGSGDPGAPADPAGGRRPPVSIIIPARNAAGTLPATLEAALGQDYEGPIEVIVADGSETPETTEMIRRRFPEVRVVPNPDRATPAALNRALRVAAHRIVVRCDAHAVFPGNYVATAVATLARTGAANVGGRQVPVGQTVFERAVALATTTFLGTGGARWRQGGREGPTDTVYLGAFRREALDAVGGYDASLLRNQDYDLNWRLRASGETVWFDPALSVAYRPRAGLRALARQYFEYGWWKRVVLRRFPESGRARHRAAPLLLLGLLFSLFASAAGASLLEAGATAAGEAVLGAAALAPAAYLLLLLAGSLAVGVRRATPYALGMPLVLAVMHLSWAAGFWMSPGRERPAASPALQEDRAAVPAPAPHTDRATARR